MLKKSISFTNFDGRQVTKDYYFNITKAEIALRELESDGTWSESLEIIKNSNKGSVVMPEFRRILQWMYGEKDGDAFVKSEEVWSRFNNSEPWSVLIMELLQNAGYAAEFIAAAMPADMRGQVSEAAKAGFRPGADTSRPVPPNARVADPEPEHILTQIGTENQVALQDAEYQEWLAAKKAEAAKVEEAQRATWLDAPTDALATNQEYNETAARHVSEPRPDLFPSE